MIKICNKAVANNHHAIQCDKYRSWIHIKCNKINLSTYRHLQECIYAFYCIKCFEDSIPLSNILNDDLYETNVRKKIKFKALPRKQNFQNHDLIEKLNNAMDNSDSEILSSKYVEKHELILLLKNKSSLFFFHLNISPIPLISKNFRHYYLLTYHLLIY